MWDQLFYKSSLIGLRHSSIESNKQKVGDRTKVFLALTKKSRILVAACGCILHSSALAFCIQSKTAAMREVLNSDGELEGDFVSQKHLVAFNLKTSLVWTRALPGDFRQAYLATKYEGRVICFPTRHTHTGENIKAGKVRKD